MTRLGFTAVVLAISTITYAQTPSPGDTSTFISEMAIAGMAEVQLGQMASERAANKDVKAFGQMMVKDHTQANNELKQIASQMKVTPPAQLDQKHRDLANRLSKLQGAAFDREYMAAMVSGHEEVVAKLRTRAGNRLTSNAPAGGGDRPATGSAGQGSATADRSPAVGTSGNNAQGDPALTQWAAKTLPAVQRHLDEARSLQQQVK